MLSGVDRFDLNLGVRLSMTLRSAVAFFRLHLIDTDLGGLAVLHDVCADGRALDHRLAEYNVFAVDHSQNLVKLDTVARSRVELFDEYDVALGNAVLLAAGHNDCMLHE